MLFWKLITHSFRQVLGNLKAAIIAFVPLIIVLLVATVLGLWTINAESNPRYIWVGFTVGFLASLVTSVWGVVAWHRYILLEERMNGPFPRFNAPRILAYIGILILVYLVALLMLFVVATVMSIAVSILGSSLNPKVTTFIVLVGVIIFGSGFGVFFVRLSLMLPAVAIDSGKKLPEIRDATQGQFWTIFGAILTLSLLGGMGSLVFQWVSSSFPILGITLTLLFQIFLAIVQVSFLTTLYGYYVEKRQLI